MSSRSYTITSRYSVKSSHSHPVTSHYSTKSSRSHPVTSRCSTKSSRSHPVTSRSYAKSSRSHPVTSRCSIINKKSSTHRCSDDSAASSFFIKQSNPLLLAILPLCPSAPKGVQHLCVRNGHMPLFAYRSDGEDRAS